MIVIYREWLKSVPPELTGDPLWTIEAYRLALFAADIGWTDVTRLMQDKRTVDMAGQLYRALGSIAANISEGLSRNSGRDRARFYEYSLGSAREARTWYYGARHILGQLVARHRMQLLTQIIRLLLVMIPDQRGGALREGATEYRVGADSFFHDTTSLPSLDQLLDAIP
jgi:four helix bundle protein